MRSFTTLIGLAAVASAQLLPAAEIAAIPFPSDKSAPLGKGAGSDVVKYDASGVYSSTYNSVYASAGSSVKRGLRARHTDGDCSPQPLGSGPTPSPDTDTAFLADSDLSNAALNAQTPSGWVQTFQNLQASTSAPMGYLGYWSLNSYDTNQCASLCDSTSGCTAFNIYFERDPTLDSGANCTNPPSTTVIKCAYWGAPIEPDTATNVGQYCEDFHIVIAGSNGYVKQQPSYSVPGYNGTFVGNSAINAPTACNSYITYKVFNDGQPFDPNRCAAACDAESQYNIQNLNSRAICRFFDTYVLLKDGVSQGQVCSMYTRSWDSSYATNTGYSYGNDTYTIEYSYIWSNTTDPGAQICDATCMSQSPCPSGSSSSSTTTSSTMFMSSTTISASSTTSTTSSTTSSVTSSTAASTTSSANTSTTSSGTTTSTNQSSTTSAAISSTTSLTTTAKATSTTSATTSSTTSAAKTTTALTTASSTTSSTTSAAKTTTASTTTSSTTKCTTTTTTALASTTLQTTTTSKSTTTATTTTTTSTTPSATGPCFRVKATGSSFLQNQYLTLDTSTLSKLSYSTVTTTPSILYIDSQGLLRDATDNNYIMRTTANMFNPFYGYMAKVGAMTINVAKNSGSGTLTFSTMSSNSKVWANKNDGGVMQGNCPGSSWTEVTMSYESVVCPASANIGWTSW